MGGVCYGIAKLIGPGTKKRLAASLKDSDVYGIVYSGSKRRACLCGCDNRMYMEGNMQLEEAGGHLPTFYLRWEKDENGSVHDF